MQSKTRNTLVGAPDECIFIVVNPTRGWDTSTLIGILDFYFFFFWTFCKERTKATGFAVEVILLPTVKINMYTDIDIFKEDINTFLWNDKEGNKEKRTLGNLRDVWEGCCWHTKTGHGSQRQGRRAPISSHYLTNTICRREWTLQPVDMWHREEFISFFSLWFCIYLDIFCTSERDGLKHSHTLSPSSRCCYLFHFLLLQWLTRGSTLAWSRPDPSNHKEWLYCSRGGDFPGCHSWGSR